jgi:Na+-driven multidrug efflux pump
MTRDLTQDMTSGNLTMLILKFAIPMLIGNIFQQFYSMVDAMVVGKFVGHNALAAVGATGPLNYFIYALIFGLMTGVSIVISQYFGAKDNEKEGDLKVVEVGVQAIRVTSFFYVLVEMILVSRFFSSGAGDTKTPMVMGFTEVVCRVVFTTVLSLKFGYYGIWWATALNWFVTSMVGILRVASGGWKNKSIVKHA